MVDHVVIVGREDRLSENDQLVAQKPFRKVQRIIGGGARRQDSVAAGLRQLTPDVQFVAIHDAARPFTTPELMSRVYAAAREHGAAAAAAPVTDTLKRADSQHIVRGSVDRADLYAMQTPQIFSRELIEEAYRSVQAAGAEITDEISAVEFIGRDAVLVPHDSWNPKITFPRDIQLAEALLRVRGSESS